MNNEHFVMLQLSVTTADEEEALDLGTIRSPSTDEADLLAPGTYRVIDGQIFQIMPGIPQLP